MAVRSRRRNARSGNGASTKSNGRRSRRMSRRQLPQMVLIGLSLAMTGSLYRSFRNTTRTTSTGAVVSRIDEEIKNTDDSVVTLTDTTKAATALLPRGTVVAVANSTNTSSSTVINPADKAPSTRTTTTTAATHNETHDTSASPRRNVLSEVAANVNNGSNGTATREAAEALSSIAKTDSTGMIGDNLADPKASKNATIPKSTTFAHNHSPATSAANVSATSATTTSATATIAYAVSVTGCGGKFPTGDPAAVLEHSIHRAHEGSRYDYHLYAIYHPSAEHCALPLKQLGYRLLKRETFVRPEDIQGEFLRERIPKSGCCGEKELVKFEAYTLTDYPIVVLLDLDCLILKPMDDLFDVMLMTGRNETSASEPNLHSDRFKKALKWPNITLPQKINAFFTKDYLMGIPTDQKNMPFQGGFLVLRPSMAVYKEFKEIVRIGDFVPGEGWGSSGVGIFYGGVTFQGLLPYFYDVLHPGQAVELSSCIYNNMNHDPIKDVEVSTDDNDNDDDDDDDGSSKKKVEMCVTGQPLDECEDCRLRPLEDIVSVHYTGVCNKPWRCMPHQFRGVASKACRKLSREWFRIRSDLELSWNRTGEGNSPPWTHRDHFHGYCTAANDDGYVPIEQPYGRRASVVK